MDSCEILEGIASTREITRHAIQNGKPFYKPRAPNTPNGDDFIAVGALYEALSLFCRLEGLDQNSIVILNEVDPDSDFYKPLDFSSTYMHSVLTMDCRGHFRYLDPNFYLERLGRYLQALGLGSYMHQLKNTQPLPIVLPNGPMSKFNNEIVREFAQKAQREKHVVICQTGSARCKRFDDSHIAQIATQIRRRYKTAHITIVTDKHFLSDGKVDRTKFPFNDHEFVKETYDHKHIQQISDVDEIIASTDINEIAGYFLSAHALVTTDSFWSWLSAGVRRMNSEYLRRRIDDIFVLHTVAHPIRWAVPGVNYVMGKLLSGCRDDRNMSSIIPNEYILKARKAGPDCDANHLPIMDDDIETLKNRLEHLCM